MRITLNVDDDVLIAVKEVAAPESKPAGATQRRRQGTCELVFERGAAQRSVSCSVPVCGVRK